MVNKRKHQESNIRFFRMPNKRGDRAVVASARMKKARGPSTPAATALPAPAPVRPPGHLGSAVIQSDLGGGGKFLVALVDIVVVYVTYPTLDGKYFVLHEHNDLWAECLLVLKNGRVVCGYMDFLVRVWDVNDVTQSFCLSLHGHTGDVVCLAELPDGSIVSGARDNTLRIWDTNTEYANAFCLGTKDQSSVWGCCPMGVWSVEVAMGLCVCGM
jgi:hypothetical protein